jgi:hypothetical protein
MMVRLQENPAARRQRLRRREILRPAFEHDGAADRTAHRPTHARPFDRRPGMQDDVLAKLGDHVLRRHHINQHGIACEHPAQGLRGGGVVRPANGIAAVVEPAQQLGQPRIAARGRAPVHGRDRHADCGQLIGKALEADIDDLEFASEKSAHFTRVHRSRSAWHQTVAALAARSCARGGCRYRTL